jgi:hypothetical protein
MDDTSSGRKVYVKVDAELMRPDCSLGDGGFFERNDRKRSEGWTWERSGFLFEHALNRFDNNWHDEFDDSRCIQTSGRPHHRSSW